MRILNIYGSATKTGKLALSNVRLFNEFLRVNKGKKLYIKIEAVELTGTEAQQYHVRRIVIPRIQEAMREHGEIMNARDAELFVLDQTGHTVTNIDNLNRQELSQLIDDIKMVAARDLQIIIE